MKRRALLRGSAALILALLAAAPARADSLTVFAAESLKESLDAATRAFQEKTGHQVAVTYGPVSQLARHIHNGAPADVFIADGAEPIDELEGRRMLVPGSRRKLLGNELVLIASAGSTGEAKLVPGVDLAALAAGKKLVVTHPNQHAAGKSARAALGSLGAWDPMVKHMAVVNDVRSAVAAVARGQAALAIVYRTDALAEKAVRIVDTFPAGSHPPVTFTLAQVARMSPPAAFDLADFLASPDAAAIFQRFGFRAP